MNRVQVAPASPCPRMVVGLSDLSIPLGTLILCFVRVLECVGSTGPKNMGHRFRSLFEPQVSLDTQAAFWIPLVSVSIQPPTRVENASPLNEAPGRK